MLSRRAIGRTITSISFANLPSASPPRSAEVGAQVLHEIGSTADCYISGYYARVVAFRMLVEKFIRMLNKACQVISLGAGFDTLFWHLHSKSLCPTLYLEIDFNSVVAKKCHTIRYFPHHIAELHL
jgi:O-methyltransferase involved in polyketide biosynthesis